MNKAIFFDRDGVLVELINGHAAWRVEELKLNSDINYLKLLNEYYLFLISNQPDAANGKTIYAELHKIHDKFDEILKSKEIYFKRYYYCYHRKEDNCHCRKPSPYFILKAKEDFNLDLSQSWMIGDRDTDIECGMNAGIKTIKINNMNLKNVMEEILSD